MAITVRNSKNTKRFRTAPSAPFGTSNTATRVERTKTQVGMHKGFTPAKRTKGYTGQSGHGVTDFGMPHPTYSGNHRAANVRHTEHLTTKYSVGKGAVAVAAGAAAVGGGAYAYHHRTQIADHAKSFKSSVKNHRMR